MENNGRYPIYGVITRIVGQGVLEKEHILFTDIEYIKDNKPPVRNHRLFGDHNRYKEYIGNHFTLNQTDGQMPPEQSFHIILENEPILKIFP